MLPCREEIGGDKKSEEAEIRSERWRQVLPGKRVASQVLVLVPFEIPALGVCEKPCVLIIIYSYLVFFVS